MKFLLLPSTLAFATTAMVSGMALLWTAPGRAGGARGVSPHEATQLINNNNAVVFDLRDASDFAAGSVTAARNIPAGEIASRAADLARFKNRPVVLIGANGAPVTKAIAALNTAGFAEVYNLTGGIGGWREAGMPLIKPQAKEQQSGLKKEK